MAAISADSCMAANSDGNFTRASRFHTASRVKSISFLMYSVLIIETTTQKDTILFEVLWVCSDEAFCLCDLSVSCPLV